MRVYCDKCNTSWIDDTQSLHNYDAKGKCKDCGYQSKVTIEDESQIELKIVSKFNEIGYERIFQIYCTSSLASSGEKLPELL